jgi:hypothetical protein
MRFLDGARYQSARERAMKPAIIWVYCRGVLLAVAAAFVIAAPERDRGPVLIDGSRPVIEEQVRWKLASDGWTNVQVVRRGRLVVAMGSKDGRTDASKSTPSQGGFVPLTTMIIRNGATEHFT